MTSHLLLINSASLALHRCTNQRGKGARPPLKMKCNETWMCTPNARLPPILLLCDDVITHLLQRHVVCRAQRGQNHQ